MPLVLHNVEDTDFDNWTEFDDLCADGLVAPVLHWTCTPSEERQRWSLKQQHDIFKYDPTAKFVKVVDTELRSGKGETIALARWHFYKHGYQHPEMTSLELPGSDPKDAAYPEGLDWSLMEALMVPLFEARQHWIGHAPQWILTTLVTRASHRRRGAGGMLVNWGVEQARKDGISAFLEASPEGKSLYEKCGFKQVGKLEYDASIFAGLNSLVIAQMAFSP